MTEHKLSATDAALRERLTELCVHIPCGGLRGPLQRRSPHQPAMWARWQSCADEDAPETWQGCDVSRDRDLCIICFRGTAGGMSRWSWLACENCRAVNSSIERISGTRPFALGRHSLMNGIGVRVGAPREVTDAQLARLVEFARGDGRLRSWRQREYFRLAGAFDPLADVPFRTWQEHWPPSRQASIDAFSRLLGGDLGQLRARG